jgi:hypothetical protein
VISTKTAAAESLIPPSAPANTPQTDKTTPIKADMDATAKVQPDVANQAAATIAGIAAKNPQTPPAKKHRTKNLKVSPQQLEPIQEQQPEPVGGTKVATVADVEAAVSSKAALGEEQDKLQTAQLAQQQAYVKTRILELETKRQKRELLLEDVPTYSHQLQLVQQALSEGSQASMDPALAEMDKALETCSLNETFVAKKLDRLSKLYRGRNLDAQLEKKIKDVFTKVHASYFSGNFLQANLHLNEIWRLIREAKP